MCTFIFWIFLIGMSVFWVFIQFGQGLKLKTFEHTMVEDLPRELDVWRGMCGVFCLCDRRRRREIAF